MCMLRFASLSSPMGEREDSPNSAREKATGHRAEPARFSRLVVLALARISAGVCVPVPSIVSLPPTGRWSRAAGRKAAGALSEMQDCRHPKPERPDRLLLGVPLAP